MANGFLDDLPELDIPGKRRKKKLPGSVGSGSEDEAVRYVRLRCPKCGSTNVPVQHTNPNVGGNIVRHHKCSDCGNRFKSVEE